MKKKVWFSLIIAVLVVVLSLGMVACNKKKKQQQQDQQQQDAQGSTLVVGYDQFSNKFSPFFSETSYDQDVWTLTQIGLLAADRQGAIVMDGITGEDIVYNGTSYHYEGLGKVVVTQDPTGEPAGTVYYDITIRNGDKTIKFSDGQPVTIDDVIFSFYVFSDPTYDGPTTFNSLPIKGMREYKLDLTTAQIAQFEPIAEAIKAAYESTISAYNTQIAALQDAFDTTFADAIETRDNAIAAADAAYDAAVDAAEDAYKAVIRSATATDAEKEAALETYLAAVEDAEDDYDAAYASAMATYKATDGLAAATTQLKADKAAVSIADYTVQGGDTFTQAQYDDYYAKIWPIGGAALVNDIVSYCRDTYWADYAEDFAKDEIALGMGTWGFGEMGTLDLVASASADEKKGGAYSEDGDKLYKKDNTVADEDAAFILGTDKYVRARGTDTTGLFVVSDTHVKSGAPIAVEAYTGDVLVYVNNDTFYTAVTGSEFDFSTAAKTPTAATYLAEIQAAYNSFYKAANVEAANYDYETYMTEVTNAWMKKAAQDAGQTASVPSVAGIVRTSDNSVRIITTEFSATTIYQLAIAVAPMHYYGSTAKYDYSNNKFGFDKGNLESVRAKTENPMGAGPYKFISYENGIVSFEANEGYWEGTPKIKYVKFKEYSSDSDKTPALENGDIDIATPSISNTVVSEIQSFNSNGQLTGNGITTDLIDFNGYGYIGICAKVVHVEGDVTGSTEASKNLRRGFATLFAAYREYTVNSYYGDRASVINYPISNCSWAAPQPNDDGYAIAFSKDVDGNNIYTDTMTEEQRWAAALDAAKGFFIAAGYNFDGATQKFTNVPTYTFLIPGGGSGDHPTLNLANAVSDALSTIGVKLKVKDLSNSNELWTGLAAHTVAFWAAAWGGSSDPDMYQVYHSSNATGSNHYCIADDTLDTLIINARKSSDLTYRKGLYKQALNKIIDWAVEVPVYQRKECVIYSTARVNTNTLTPDRTPYWSYLAELYKLEMNA